MSRSSCRLKAKDVRLGVAYEVRVAGRRCPVKITSIASPGVWLGTNCRTGRPVYVVLPDLGPVVPDRPAQRDGRAAAAGDVP
ncbi:MAG: hypothetical protein JWN34_37 [Bryobacterales bacterium]|nr:hypothetical protein [Bryobacterales bacterium]